jgi:hypothetical protein
MLMRLLTASSDATSGSILFGGVDSSKYTGDLVVLPLQTDADSGILNSYTVTLAGVSVSGNGGNSVYSANTSSPCLLDSGNSIAYLPADIGYDILAGVGAVNDTDLGTFVVPCDLASSQGVFSFRFGNSDGPVVKVPISEFVLPVSTPAPTFNNGKQACQWALLPDNGNGVTLGDTFLRSAYVVYNIDGKEVGIAQTNFQGTDSNVTEITASNSIPGATSTATGVATLATGTPTATVPIVTGTDNIAVNSATATFDLGSSTTSKPSKGAAAGLTPPSTPFVGTAITGIVVLFATLGGSMFVFV